MIGKGLGMAEHPLQPMIDAYNDAWNRHDVDAILSMHTEDSVFENHTSGGKGVGRDAIGEIVSDVFRTFPDIRFELRH
jgi:ketosteroid isomerase-like protein